MLQTWYKSVQLLLGMTVTNEENNFICTYIHFQQLLQNFILHEPFDDQNLC